MMSYLINNGMSIAKTNEKLTSGILVRFSHTITNCNFSKTKTNSLVNADYAKISNARKWDKNDYTPLAVRINNDDDLYKEFYIEI